MKPTRAPSGSLDETPVAQAPGQDRVSETYGQVSCLTVTPTSARLERQRLSRTATAMRRPWRSPTRPSGLASVTSRSQRSVASVDCKGKCDIACRRVLVDTVVRQRPALAESASTIESACLLPAWNRRMDQTDLLPFGDRLSPSKQPGDPASVALSTASMMLRGRTRTEPHCPK